MNKEIAVFIKNCESSGLAKNTLKTYNSVLIQYFSKYKTISTANITEFANTAKTVRTRNARLIVINKFLKFIGKHKIVKDLKERGVKPTTPRRELKRILSISEIKKLFSVMDNDMYRLFFKLLFYTGCRLHEILNISIEDINIEKSLIKIHTKAVGKAKPRERYVPFPESLKSEIKQYINKYELPNNKLFPVHHTTMQYKIKKYAKLANLPYKEISPHTLRHSFAVYFLEHTKTPDALPMLSSILGHSDIKITQVYLDYTPEMIAEKYKKVFP